MNIETEVPTNVFFLLFAVTVFTIREKRNECIYVKIYYVEFRQRFNNKLVCSITIILVYLHLPLLPFHYQLIHFHSTFM